MLALQDGRTLLESVWQLNLQELDAPVVPWGRDGIIVDSIVFEGESRVCFSLALPTNYFSSFDRGLNINLTFDGVRRFIALDAQTYGEKMWKLYAGSELSHILSGFYRFSSLDARISGPATEGDFYCIGAYDKLYIVDVFDAGSVDVNLDRAHGEQ